MKPVIIFQSKSGNTISVAEAMAAAIQADMQDAEKLAPASLAGRTLVGLGSGIYTMGHLPHVLRLPPHLPAGCKVFIFSTSGSAGWMPPPAYRFTHWRLRRALRRKKIAILGEWECPGQVKGGICGWFGWYRGRPDEADLAAAARFAQNMLEKANDASSKEVKP